MRLSGTDQKLCDVIGKTLAMPGGAKLLEDAATEARRQAQDAVRTVSDTMRKRVESRFLSVLLGNPPAFPGAVTQAEVDRAMRQFA